MDEAKQEARKMNMAVLAVSLETVESVVLNVGGD